MFRLHTIRYDTYAQLECEVAPNVENDTFLALDPVPEADLIEMKPVEPKP